MQPSPRKKIMKCSINKQKIMDAECIRFTMQAEDTKVPQRPGEVYDIDAYGFTCIHPMDRGVLAVVEYSRRTPKGTPHADDQKVGEDFLKSFRFSAISELRIDEQ